MNELIASTKDYLLPNTPGIIDYPNDNTESQLYRLAITVTRNIIDAYIRVKHWLENNKAISEESILIHALKNCFPEDWLAVAMKSNNHYLKTVPPFLNFYNLSLTKESIVMINRIVEFLCYEIIESALIEAKFCAISELSPRHLLKAVKNDPVLDHIIQQNQIYIIGHCRLSPNYLEMSDEWRSRLSSKAIKLILIYVEQRVKDLLKFSNHALSEEKINMFFCC